MSQCFVKYINKVISDMSISLHVYKKFILLQNSPCVTYIITILQYKIKCGTPYACILKILINPNNERQLVILDNLGRTYWRWPRFTYVFWIKMYLSHWLYTKYVLIQILTILIKNWKQYKLGTHIYLRTYLFNYV